MTTRRACEYPECYKVQKTSSMYRLENGEWLCMEHAAIVLKEHPTPSKRYQLAMAAGQDAGNRSMRAAGRKQWDDTDFDVAVATFNATFGLPTP